MKDKINQAFEELKAADELKGKTLQYLKQYDQKQERRSFVPGKALVFASILLMLCLGGVSYQAYFTPVSFMDIDVNPSIELIINRFDKVIEAEAYNDEGTEILNRLSIKHKSYEDTVELLIEAMEEEGYLTDRGLLSVTVQSYKNEDEMLGRIGKYIYDMLKEVNVEVEAEIYAVDADTRTHAHASGVSPAKYLAISELMEVDDTTTFEECQGHSISELREYTYQHGQEYHDNTEEDSDHHNENSSGKKKRKGHE